MTVLSINNLEYLNIIKGLNISLTDKSFNIILGSNGSGKTTLVNLILNAKKHKEKIKINLSSQEIGIVTPNNILIENNVFKNLIYPLENLNINDAKKEVNDFAIKFNIEGILYKKIDELSNSEKKLVEILVSLIHKPKLIIIDDNLDDLDNTSKIKILDYLKKCSDECCVLLLTSSSDYLNYASNIYLLDEGSILKQITYEEIAYEEKIFNRISIKYPFFFDLNAKLKFYGLLREDCKNYDEVVNKIWN